VSERDLESIVGRDGVLAFSSPWLPSDVPLARPADESALAELLRYAARDGKKVLPIGFGSKLGWSAPAEHPDFALTTRAMSGVIAYEPGDGTITARAGTTMSDLAQVARAGGNHLTPDVASPDTATLGGVLAAGQSGIDRTRHGPSRHHVLGMKVALADGTIARSGGRLVKNVTGYDMHRLYCGSRGSLCVIVEASLRLFPGAQHTIAVHTTIKQGTDALRAARAVVDAGVRAYAVVVENSSNAREWNVHVLLAGREETVEWEASAVQRCLPFAILERDARARAHFEALRDLRSPRTRTGSLHIEVMPSKIEDALTAIGIVASGMGLRATCTIEPGIATVDLAPSMQDGSPVSLVEWLPLSGVLRHAAFDVRVRGLPTEILRELRSSKVPDLATAAFLTLAPAGLDWMQRLKRALDPLGVFARGVPDT
jgi:FAD/FMN-containing dehydrogenase